MQMFMEKHNHQDLEKMLLHFHWTLIVLVLNFLYWVVFLVMSRIHKKVHVNGLNGNFAYELLTKTCLSFINLFQSRFNFFLYKLCMLCMCFPKNIIFHLFLFCSKLLRTEFGSRRLVQSLASEEPRLIKRRRGPSSAIYI